MPNSVVWIGAEALRPFLVPIEELEPSPLNPRRGDVETVRESLRRFGQVRPVLVHGNRTIAGHHVIRAAEQEGWSHVAAIPNEFVDDEEARRYLLMDNRSHDVGEYDLQGLHELLSDLRATPAVFEGTGYDDQAYERLSEDLAKLFASQQPPPYFPTLDPNGIETNYCCPSCGYEWSGNPKP